MKCVICKNGDTKEGLTTTTLTKGTATIIFHDVPAEICQNCGESYFSEKTSTQLLNIAEEAFKSGVQVEVRGYLAA